MAQALGNDPHYHEWVNSKLVEANIQGVTKNVWDYNQENHFGIYFHGRCDDKICKGSQKTLCEDAAAKMDMPIQFLQQCHHDFYAEGWKRQSEEFKVMKATGITPNQTFFDVGCGSMRLGVKMTEYLEKGHYYGLEPNSLSLRAAIQHEVPMAGLMEKDPHLLKSSHFEMPKIAPKESIDLIAAMYVLKSEQFFEPFFRNAAKVLKKGGKALVVGIDHTNPSNLIKIAAKHGLVQGSLSPELLKASIKLDLSKSDGEPLQTNKNDEEIDKPKTFMFHKA